MAMLFLRMLSQTCYAQRICADTNSSCARNVRRNGEKMNQTERILEFDKIKEIWSALALTDSAKREIRETEPVLSEVELRARLRETTEAKTMMEEMGTPPLSAMEGVRELMNVAERGDCLTAAQLEQAESALTAVKRLKDYLNRCKALELSLPWYEQNLDELDETRESIHVKIRNGAVDDYASKLLHELRSGIVRLEEKMKEKAEAVIRSYKECMSDSYSVNRNGHLCVPVKKEYKFRVSGSVIDKSATGNTLFIEPTAVAKYSEELQLMRIDEENEERRILYTLSAMLGEQGETMEQNLRTMEKLDFCFFKGKLSMELGCAAPDINTERRIRLTAARHPLMDRTVCVPQGFCIGETDGNLKQTPDVETKPEQAGNAEKKQAQCADYRGVVITGPNTGGKTVAIKTVAVNCMMAQCGLHVCCEQADICMNSNYLCDIGDGQNLSENLSTFSAHITNVLDILKKVNRESLVIMDELGSGTDPAEGMGIAVAILEELRRSGCLFLVTTHYPEVKTYAEQAEGIINARMTFDKESLRPLYKMEIGEAGESCAFYIAARLGMPEAMLRTAERAAYGAGMGEASKPREIPKPPCGDCAEGTGVPANADIPEPEKTERKRTAYQQGPRIQKKNNNGALTGQKAELTEKFQRGDSVMVYPDKKIGIVCEPVNEKGVLRVQLRDRKIWISHKRVRLQVAAAELYPEDYDFSIIFDSVETRKLRHKMERKYVEGAELHLDQD